MFKGSFVAVITPFQKDGSVDYLAFENLVKWHIDQKTDGIVCCGTTGECSTLEPSEKLELLKRCVSICIGKIPVVMNTGTNNTKETVWLTEQAKALRADGALVITPYYNCPNMKGCIAHFEQVNQVGLPVIIYHNPKRTSITLDLETIKTMADLRHVLAIKESSGDLKLAKRILQETSLEVLSGDDFSTLELLRLGACGAISVIGNVVPKEYQNWIQLGLAQKLGEFDEMYKYFESILHALTLEPNPQCVKYMLSLMDKCKLFYRLPLLPPDEKNKELIEKAYEGVKVAIC